MSSFRKQDSSLEPPFGDPYELLNLPPSATSADIEKAFRKLSLQLHPDKQRGKSESEQKIIAQRFHDLNEAKLFLLDPSKRQPYDAQRSSRLRRQELERERSKQQSNRQSAFREELRRKEQEALQAKKKHSSTTSSTDKDHLVNELRQEGKRRRQEYEERQADLNYQKLKKQRKVDKVEQQKRQVRLRWSRKRLTISPSEDSLRKLLSQQFGDVESVEFIGSKGNSALVTFCSESSCQPCVDFYKSSDEMRATRVMEVSEEELVDEVRDTSTYRDGETLEQRRLRQAAEREALLREMQDESTTATKKTTIRPRTSTKYPLDFPNDDETNDLTTPLDKLQHWEKKLFHNRIPKQLLEQMRL
jgi:DnaJ family protein C protein 17